MNANRPATKSWFRFQFSLASLVFMSVVAGVLFFVNFQRNENWYVCLGWGNYGLPFYTKPAIGYGWPYMVSTWLTSFPAWSWIGLCGNVVFGGSVLFLLGVLFEVGCRWSRKRMRFQFSRREWLALTLCASAFLAVNWWPRNISIAWPGTALVEIHSVRGWPWPWYGERIANGVPANSQAVVNLPVMTGFDDGQIVKVGGVLDFLVGVLLCGLFAAFLIWLRRHREAAAVR